MAGRTSDIQTSSFKPLDLNEIMMVPLAKQKMEDEILMGADKFGALTSDVLGADSEAATGTINSFKDRASALSDEVISGGVSRSQFNKLRALRGETNAEMSSGFVGKAMANKKAAAQYIQALATKKERQAGWSPKQAQQWAQAQVSGDESRGIAGFQGTQNDDGSFNSFTGQEMALKVDEDEFLKDAVDSVSEHVGQEALAAVRIGGIPAFQRAFQEGTIKSKDYNRIMDAIITKSMNNPDLLASLQQQAFFTGEEDPFDMGHFDYKTVKGKDGKDHTERTFVNGTSRYGRKAAGLGRASWYSNKNIDTRFLKDEIGLKMYTDGMDQRSALNVLQFNQGEMMQDKVKSLSVIKENIELYGGEAKKYLGFAKAREKELLEGGATPDEVKLDREYKRLDKAYMDGNTAYKNSKARMANMYKRTEAKMTPGDQKLKKGFDILDQYDGDAIKALQAISPDELKRNISANRLKYGENEEERARRIIFQKGGIELGHGMSSFLHTTNGYNKRREDVLEEYLVADPTASAFTRLNGESTGKFATRIGRTNALMSKEFSMDGAVLANSLGDVKTNHEITDLGDLEEGKGYIYQVEGTDGFDDNGDHFNNVIVRNPSTGKSTSVQVVDNLNNTELMAQAHLLQQGNYAQNKLGVEIEAKINYMKQIKKGGLGAQKTGVIPLANLFNPISKKRLTTTYQMVTAIDGLKYYKVMIGDTDINDGQPLYGETEVAVALQKFMTELENDK